MAQLSLYQALTIYGWFPLAFTLAVLLLIARFYQRFSGKTTFWRLYTLPILGYAAAHVREAAVGLPYDEFADILQTVSGGLLMALLLRLTLLMLWKREVVVSAAPVAMLGGGVLGDIGVAVALFILGRFTRRMVRLTRQPAYHQFYYIATLGMGIAAGLRFVSPEVSPASLLLYPALVAVSTTIGATVSWRTWSWLLAERA